MSAVLDEHASRIAEWTEHLLRPYVDSLRDKSRAPSTKEFNDPVWGTVYLNPHEVLVLDSPLLQRLRTIRQLGVVHFVYQGATHSRLEHSIGVVHQVQRMMTSLNDRGHVGEPPEAPSRVVDDHLVTTLRLTALCHDIGHGFMSHVSEFALEHNRDCEDLQLDFQRTHSRPTETQLSEMAAYYAIGSPAFSDLIDEVFRLSRAQRPPRLIENMQGLVVGKAIDERLILVQEFISGPFDADKLDYYARDSRMCGIPNVTDIPRLIQKLRAAHAERDSLPKALRQGAPRHGKGYTVTGIAVSGGRTLDELALARTLLYDKVYRHQKVRAIESMVFRIVNLLSEMTDAHPAMVPLLLNDDDVLHLDPERILKIAGRDAHESLTPSLDVMTDLSRRLRERDLFARGFAFASVMTDDDYRNDQNQTSGMQRFLQDAAKRPREFTQQVCELVKEICLSIDHEVTFDLDRIHDYIRLSPPKSHDSGRRESTGNAQLVESDGKITTFRDDAAETTPWSNAYIATRDLGHVFCPPEIAPIVFIATQAALLQSYAVRVPVSMLHYAKQDSTLIEELRGKLETRGWYDGRPYELRPTPQALSRADLEDKLGQVSDQLRGYWGPSRVDSANDSVGPAGTVGATQALAFVKQFAEGGSDLVGAALEMLKHLRVVGREDAARAISDFVSEHDTFRGASCSPLGAGKDSGSVVAYFVNDVADDLELTVRRLHEAIAHDAPIIFVDDFIGTGRQAIDIVESWLGEERTHPLNEDREVLPEETATLLRARKLAFVFAAATGDGADSFQARLTQLGLDATVSVGLTSSDLPSLHTIPLEDDTRERLVDFARRIGDRLLQRHDGKVRPEEWRAARHLGYGNDAFLIASSFNTPTASLTALWAADESWHPLLARRPKR